MYGCETWSLTLREKRRLRAFENGVLRGIFGPKGDKMKGAWRQLHIEELNEICLSLYCIRVTKSRIMSWPEHVARMEAGEVCTGLCCGKPERKRQLGRPRLRWEDNIKINLQEVGWWHGLASSGSG